MAAEVRMEGLDDLLAKLKELVPAMRKRVIRNALSAGARVVRDEAKRNAPVLSNQLKAPYRKPGTVRDAIRVRTSKVARKAGDVGVFVNVRPAKSGDRGAKSRNDPFYWRWLEFGRTARAYQGERARVARIKGVRKGVRSRRALSAVGRIEPMGFMRRSVDRLSDALSIFQDQVGRWIDKVNSSGKVVP